jgi:hypothetical protein
MGLPVRSRMPKEAASLPSVQPFPERWCIGPDRRDNFPPVDAVHRAIAHLATQATQETNCS